MKPGDRDENGGRDVPRTRDIAAAMEKVVRKHPEQWLWIYKRWKYIPDSRSEDEYPFYARRSARARRQPGRQDAG